MPDPEHSTYDAGIFQTDIEHKYSDGEHSGYGKTREEALDAYNEAKDRDLTYKDNTTWLSANSFIGDGDPIEEDKEDDDDVDDIDDTYDDDSDSDENDEESNDEEDEDDYGDGDGDGDDD